MSNSFKIFIDRLKRGQTQKIEERFPPTFLGPDEPELCFIAKVNVKGEAYLTDTHLIVHLKASTKISMPCAVCNQMIDADLKADPVYHAEPIEEIRDAIFDYREMLREALLIELPKTVECRGGNCPDRAVMAPYLRSQARSKTASYFPFAGMDDDFKKGE